ncbi:hypothetical protein DXB83_10440 [Blautia sp. OM06-15AC]|uniref:hypothetical protein n=1 Tax=Blautia sp. OM06-15AC TaxID=2292984 RepID=UPI000E50FB24|nr:hypothetical protein [Blautia sp. OM06-15AC]RHV10871.1 hypothetical protein DXB83_10440 [Blautia sp. OM06-15AC]
MKKIFSENIELITTFYNSDLYKKFLFGNTKAIKRTIEAIYRDPDMLDKALICKAEEYNTKFKDRKINLCFAPDGICGWKILFDVYSVNGDNSWIEKYEAIRGSKYGELYFPCKIDQEGHKTINIERNVLLGDRIDMFLYDLKLKIDNKDPQNCKLSYKNQYSKQFLKYYQDLKYGFEQYINDFGLGEFVKKDEFNKIAITNLATGNAVAQKEFDSFTWSNRYGMTKKRKNMKCYLDNLVKICNNAQNQN